MKPMRLRITPVIFPAPFGPRKPNTSPRSENDTFAAAVAG